MIIYPLLGYYRNKDDFNFLFYLLAHRDYKNPNDYSYNFTPLFWVHQSSNSYTNIFLPFYYYSESYNQKNLYVFPTIGWRFKDASETIHCHLLCLLYYGKEDSRKNNDYFLLWTFMKFEDKTKDSYEIWGLWRLLFWYENNPKEDIKRFLFLGTGIEKTRYKTHLRILFFKF
jgi:hypothetical protein